MSDDLFLAITHNKYLSLLHLHALSPSSHTEEEARWSMAGPRRPPGSEDAATRPAPSLLLRSALHVFD
jgi:hypothetical protein